MNRPLESVKVLVVEDEPILGRAISTGLADHGYDCILANSAKEAAALAQSDSFPIILIDLALDDDSGLGVLRCIRESNENASILLLTPLEFRAERVMGIESGADDFVIKPFTMRELLARVEVSLVRSKSRPSSYIEVGPLAIDLTARRAVRDGKQIALTPTEFRILELLMRNQSKVVTRRMLCEFLWNPEWEGVTNVIEVHINRLRAKIEDQTTANLIHTVRGSGYCLRWAAAEVEVA
ncbi:response regulator transcription factor [Aureliella helgolandensis]|uniref:Transcriptional activator protein CopR n=1 Tax=Aureliella helgolandensis TaxID=2527968 RepID=A0A518GGY7_9BACT|nr:response regulator transcription factor [Aureliella helgolandensis]QDV27861.1 Transcriptional activator protein CopR [Aureliella helgolandensis]